MTALTPATKAYLLLCTTTLLWGGNAVAGKLAASYWPPFLLTSARWALATVIIAPFAWRGLQQDWPVIRRHWRLLFLLGAVGMCIFNIGLYTALNYTTVINVSIEQAGMPVFIMLANFVFLAQRTTAWQLVGLALSIAGVLITATHGKPWTFFSEGLNRGDALMVLACLAYASYTFGLRWKPPMNWLSFLFCIAVAAFLTSLPFVYWEMRSTPWPEPGTNGWLLMLYIVVFPTVVAQSMYAMGVGLIGGNRAGLFINLVPVFGSLLAVLIVGESFRGYHAIGMVLVIGGILLAERSASRAAGVRIKSAG